MGDEPFMLQKNLKDIPVIVDADRIRAGKQAIRDYGVDTLILDDGFQQWKIKKDLEIVTVDSLNPFGNLNLIPRGVLREPLSSLRRADAIVLTKVGPNRDIGGIKEDLNKYNTQGEVFESDHKAECFYNISKPDELFNLDYLGRKAVTLFSGIGDPDSFGNLITSLGANIGLSFRFMDHHHYTQQDLDKIIKESQEKNIDAIITTEKDAARLDKLQITNYKLQIFVLRIRIAIKDEQRFHDRLLKLYSF